MATSTRIVSGMEIRDVESPKIPMSSYENDVIGIGPDCFIMPKPFEDWYPRYASFSALPDDVWVVTYPKSGTTWTQELVWCLLYGLDSPDVKLKLMERFPFFEFDGLLTPDWNPPPDVPLDSPIRLGNSWKKVQEEISPRPIKSHLPRDLLPSTLWKTKPKVIYVSRDPRDVCISYYFHQRKLEGYRGTLDDFVEAFLDDKCSYSPIWLHILQFWEMRNEDHILFLRYEDMQKDLKGVVQQVAAFLNVEISDGEAERVAHHCSFDQMKDNPAANNEMFVEAENNKSENIKFMRKGKSGDWKNHLNDEQIKAFKEWTELKLKDSDFPFYRDYE